MYKKNRTQVPKKYFNVLLEYFNRSTLRDGLVRKIQNKINPFDYDSPTCWSLLTASDVHVVNDGVWLLTRSIPVAADAAARMSFTRSKCINQWATGNRLPVELGLHLWDSENLCNISVKKKNTIFKYSSWKTLKRKFWRKITHDIENILNTNPTAKKKYISFSKISFDVRVCEHSSGGRDDTAVANFISR